jgi:hypothetical protein
LLVATRSTGRSLRRRWSVLPIAVFAFAVLPSGAAAQGVDRDCADFATQAEAQSFFVGAGGPAADPHRLDADNDGVACESLPCPCAASAPATDQPAQPAQDPNDCSRDTAERVVAESDFPERIEERWADVFGDDPWARDAFVVDRHFCADLTGDGVSEMVVLLACCTVSSPRPWAIFKAGDDGHMGVAFAAIRVSYVKPLRLRGGSGPYRLDVVERRSILRRRDPNCCPRGGTIYRYVRWDGQRFYVAKRVVRRKRR